MKFTTTTIAVLALASGSLANLHTRAWCNTRVPAENFRNGEKSVFNLAATQAACASYSRRNTGNKQHDKCPDCHMITYTGNNIVCESKGKHIGGDEWNYYCKQSNTFGSAD